VLNVGQGESAFVTTPHGGCIVIGEGPPEAGGSVADALQNAGVKKISLLILPYPYTEAIGGVPDLFDTFPIEMALEPGGGKINFAIIKARSLMHEYQTELRQGHAGDKFDVDGVVVEILAPTTLFPDTQAPDNSLVVALRYGNMRFLFAGGLGRAGEVALLSHTPDLSANWLNVARSGADEASSPEFLRLVNPEIAVISVGPNGDGYPGAATLGRLQATGAKLYRTDANGGQNLTFYSDGKSITTQ